MNIKDIIFAIDILSHPQSGDESDINLALYTAIEALKAWKEVLEQAERDMLDGNINRMMITSLKSIDGLLEKITQLPTEENAEGQDMYQAYDVLRTIKEYCEVKE